MTRAIPERSIGESPTTKTLIEVSFSECICSSRITQGVYVIYRVDQMSAHENPVEILNLSHVRVGIYPTKMYGSCMPKQRCSVKVLVNPVHLIEQATEEK